MLRIGLLVSAPVGQAATHSPQDTQDDAPIGSDRSNAMCVLKPLPLRPITSLPWMSSQARTHLSHRMHASWSTAITGLDRSTPRPEPQGSPSSPLTWYLSASASSSLSCVVVCLGSRSRGGWSDMSSLVSIARLRSSSGVSVLTCMPFSQARTHDAANAGAPTSTTHIRHTPTGSKRSSWHSTGMSMPAALAACQIVTPAGAVTSRPSIVSVTVPVLSWAVMAIPRSIFPLGTLSQAEAGHGRLVRAPLTVEAAPSVVRVDHRPQAVGGEGGYPPGREAERLAQQPVREPVVSGLPAHPDVVNPLGHDDPAGRF